LRRQGGSDGRPAASAAVLAATRHRVMDEIERNTRGQDLPSPLFAYVALRQFARE